MPSLHKYVEQIKEINQVLLEYLDDQDTNECKNKFDTLLQLLDKYDIKNKKNSFCTVLHLFTEISINHHRTPNFFAKLETLLQTLQTDINRNFTNDEIFDIFQKSRRLILFLINSQILHIDQMIYYKYLQQSASYQKYLQKEFSNFLNEPFTTKDENYDEKRIIGENDSYICKLIREDSIEDFVRHVTQTNYPLDSIILTSIYETNSYLIDKSPRLIEYAAFFGSIQVFQFLKFNKVELNNNLWKYVIHSNNPELIHILEENKDETTAFNFEDVVEESILCHHNNITEYIFNISSVEQKYSYFFHCYNFSFDLSKIDNGTLFCFLYDYDCLDSPITYLSDNECNVNLEIQMNSIFLNEVINFFCFELCFKLVTFFNTILILFFFNLNSNKTLLYMAVDKGDIDMVKYALKNVTILLINNTCILNFFFLIELRKFYC